MLPMALWLKQNEPDVWAAAATICECEDYLNLRVTGRLVAGARRLKRLLLREGASSGGARGGSQPVCRQGLDAGVLVRARSGGGERRRVVRGSACPGGG